MTSGPSPVGVGRQALGGDLPREAAGDHDTPFGFALGKLTTTHANRWAVFGEIVLLPLLVVGLGLGLNPDDPLWIHASFPWAWFAPVILALRYGPLAGIGSAGLLLVAWLALNVGHYESFPKLPFLGGLILVMLVGEFSSLWRARTRRAETVRVYLGQRLDYLTHQHYLLRLSHDRLEQDLISRPMAMRDALKVLRGANFAQADQHGGGDLLLRLLAQYCQLETAALHPVTGGQPGAEPLAALGQAAPLAADDSLIQQALESGKLCHVGQRTAEGKPPSRYLVAAPLANPDGEPYALLVVGEMPFFSLQDETLQTINLLLGYYTDGLAMDALARPLLQQCPECPAEFAFELQRLWHIHQTTNLGSVIVALEILPRTGERGLARQIQRMKRSLDENWLMETAGGQVLATLMPLAGRSAAEGYLERLEAWARQKNSQSLADIGIFGHILALDDGPPADLLNRLRTLAHAQSDIGSLRRAA